eukprot:m.24844 g.24844  ORF g.24844 m.24844 type:complete len:205 (-) comp8644_c0_seq1:337-951(-)
MKVQVGSQAGVSKTEALFRDTVKKYSKGKWKEPAKLKAGKRFEQLMAKVSQRAFRILHQNVTVAGHAWDYSLQADDMLPRDQSLAKELEATQLEVYQLLHTVVKHRRETPATMADLYRKATQQKQKLMQDNLVKLEASTNAAAPAQQSNDDMEKRIYRCFSRLKQMETALPDAVRLTKDLVATSAIKAHNLQVEEEIAAAAASS